MEISIRRLPPVGGPVHFGQNLSTESSESLEPGCQ